MRFYQLRLPVQLSRLTVLVCGLALFASGYATAWRVSRKDWGISALHRMGRRRNTAASCRLGTGETHAVEHNLMAFDTKTTRRKLLQIGETAADFKDTIAHPTAEMVVMPFAGNFIAQRFPRQRYGHEPLFFD